jgi:hypothetical protein
MVGIGKRDASSPRRAHPYIALLVGGQDHWHGLGMDRLDHCIGGCCQETVAQMVALDGLLLKLPP